METNKVVKQTDLLAFSSEVSRLVEQGWQLVGGVSITEDKTPDANVNTTEAKLVFTQALSWAS